MLGRCYRVTPTVTRRSHYTATTTFTALTARSRRGRTRAATPGQLRYDALLNGEYYFQGRYIYGPRAHGEYYLHDGKYVHGPDAHGEYYLMNGRVYGPGQNGEIYLIAGRFYGPANRLPWMEE